MRERARTILAEGDYQVELPAAREPGEPMHFGELPEFVGWLVIAVAAAIVLRVIVRLVRERLAARTAAAPPARPAHPEPPVAAPVASALLPTAHLDPAALAAAGRFDEAIHALLLDALQGLLARVRPQPPPGLTARELVRFGPARVTAPLEELVRLVEAGRYALRALGDADFAAAQQLRDAIGAEATA
ncbi:MAG: hypothetical protein JNL90_10840 [Planctomycetes bacterium]|nr:hypothetical protein [Planctomycetota bacterium]